MRFPIATATLCALFALLPGEAGAQEPPERLRVYLDCRSGCDFDYIRTETTFVDWVRDRTDSDVHVLITSQATGGGGSEYTMTFFGLGPYEGQADTLTYRSTRDDTPDIRRRDMTRVLKRGLLPYALSTGVADRLDVTFRAEEGEAAAETERIDPWNNWVFEVSARGFMNGESQQGFIDLFGGVSANRVTEGWKIQSGLNTSYGEQRYEVDDTTTILTIRRNYSADFLIVRSLGPHLSAGVEATVASSTFGNQELGLRLAPAVEYNFVPYAESTRRIFTLLYTAGVNSFDYREETIYGEMEETRPSHSLTAGYTTRQPWGQISASVRGSQYLHDTQKYRLTFSGNTSLRLLRGLSLNLGGTYQSIRDQLSLSAEGATRDEILLRQQQIATDYSFFMNFGLSYEFGSAINNVVNPRIRNTGGDIFFF
jgi:hypothetical protein